MVEVIKKNKVYLIIFISTIFIFIQHLIIGNNYFKLPTEIIEELPEKNMRLFYTYFFEILEQPLIQSICLALLLIIYIYIITLILYGVTLFTKIKISFNKIIEAFILSYSVIILKKIIEIIYSSDFNNLINNLIFAIVQMSIYCKIIQRHIRGEKVNNIIYNGLIILGTIISNIILIILNQI